MECLVEGSMIQILTSALSCLAHVLKDVLSDR